MKSIKTIVILTALLALCVYAMAGCETTKGLGKDIQNASEGTEKAIKGN